MFGLFVVSQALTFGRRVPVTTAAKRQFRFQSLSKSALASLFTSPISQSSYQHRVCRLFSTNYLRVDPNTMSGIEPNITVIDNSLILPFTEDKYDGAIVNSKTLPSSDEEFENMLDYSLTHWKSIHRRGIWIKIPIEKSSFIPIAIRRGFVFHHAEKNYVMVTHWLVEGESRLPPNASHQVGVGCVVINPQGKLLLVQEKSGPLKGTGVWKLPTGLVEQSEDISTAAEREVLEETGIQTRFQRLLAFRQAHGVLFGKSDLWFLCILQPLNETISAQEVEIHACDWKEPEVFFEQSFFQKSPLHSFLNQKIRHEILKHRGEVLTNQPTMRTQKFPLGFRPGEASLYFFEEETAEEVIEREIKEDHDRLKRFPASHSQELHAATK